MSLEGCSLKIKCVIFKFQQIVFVAVRFVHVGKVLVKCILVRRKLLQCRTPLVYTLNNIYR
jgi:hypothetical protein